jgi:hypothetical protein
VDWCFAKDRLENVSCHSRADGSMKANHL